MNTPPELMYVVCVGAQNTIYLIGLYRDKAAAHAIADEYNEKHPEGMPAMVGEMKVG